MSYNFDEKLGDNHYNCPVVAYYPEVISANMAEPRRTDVYPRLCRHSPQARLPHRKCTRILAQYFDGISLAGGEAGRESTLMPNTTHYMQKIREKGERDDRRRPVRRGKPIIILSGRPYHLDPEINHGIDKLITSLGAAVISEDVISAEVKKFSSRRLEPVDLSRAPVCSR